MSDTKKDSSLFGCIMAVPELLDMLCIKNCIVTIDVMGTQKDIAKKITVYFSDSIQQNKYTGKSPRSMHLNK